MPPILQAYSSMDPADMILRKAHWVTVGLWHRVQHWPWNRHSWRRYVHVSTKKQVKKQENRKKERLLLRSHFDIKPISCFQGMRKAYDERNILKFEFAT